MLDKIIDMIQNPVKAAYTVLAGTTTGYAPDLINAIEQSSKSNVDTYFQHGVWTITIIVGLTAIISFCQKQYDRFKGRKTR